MDVNNPFLYGQWTEIIYMMQPVYLGIGATILNYNLVGCKWLFSGKKKT